MKHTVLILSRSTNQSIFTKIEARVEITEEDIEQLALDKYKANHYHDDGKSWFAELDSTVHD
ncbi:MAG TPA: hypothetical protein ENH82_05420 [bacterium]|nr:hypothetical protein [bacterium]